MKRRSLYQLGLISVLAYSCATGNNKKSGGGDGGGDSGDSGGSGGDSKGEEIYNTGNLQTFTYSLNNNGLTTFTVNPSKAKSLADDLENKTANATAKDKPDLIALMAAKRLAGEGVVPVFKVAKKLMILEMRDDIRRNMPEVAMLELALASIHSRQIPMAEHWIEKLMASKNAKTKAAAFTARGMIALMDGRLPEAVAFWNDALNVKRDYEPARLNIAFTALRFGDAKTARAMFSGMDQDWFVQTGMMQAERLADNPREAAQLCGTILSKKPNYKPAAFSCALNEYQGLGNLAKARTQLESIAKNGGGPSSIDERVFVVLGKVEKEVMAEQQQKAEAAAAAKRKAAPPAAAPGGQAPAPAAQGGGQATPAVDAP